LSVGEKDKKRESSLAFSYLINSIYRKLIYQFLHCLYGKNQILPFGDLIFWGEGWGDIKKLIAKLTISFFYYYLIFIFQNH